MAHLSESLKPALATVVYKSPPDILYRGLILDTTRMLFVMVSLYFSVSECRVFVTKLAWNLLLFGILLIGPGETFLFNFLGGVIEAHSHAGRSESEGLAGSGSVYGCHLIVVATFIEVAFAFEMSHDVVNFRFRKALVFIVADFFSNGKVLFPDTHTTCHGWKL